ncbi:MAG: hypothetical protein V4629_04285 [Pseudomonadota bacterium]
MESATAFNKSLLTHDIILKSSFKQRNAKTALFSTGTAETLLIQDELFATASRTYLNNDGKNSDPQPLALCIEGLVEDYLRTGRNYFLKTATQLADKLWELRSRGWSKLAVEYPCWGMSMPWLTTQGMIPSTDPNIMTTVLVARAFYRLAQVTKQNYYRALAHSAADMIVQYLLTTDSGSCLVLKMSPNTNVFADATSGLWGAAWLAVVAAERHEQRLMVIARKLARRYSLEFINFNDPQKKLFFAQQDMYRDDPIRALMLIESVAGFLIREQDRVVMIEQCRNLYHVHETSYQIILAEPKITKHSSIRLLQNLMSRLHLQTSSQEWKSVGRLVRWMQEHLYCANQQSFSDELPQGWKLTTYSPHTQAWAYWFLANFHRRICAPNHSVKGDDSIYLKRQNLTALFESRVDGPERRKYMREQKIQNQLEENE